MVSKEKAEKYPEYYFKSGKAKKKAMLCYDKEYLAEVSRSNGIHVSAGSIGVCGGCRCPLYSIGCGKKDY